MAKIVEYCAECDREVKIQPWPYVIQKCPHCGAPIRACSLCDYDIVNCRKCQKKYTAKYCKNELNMED